MLGWIVALIIFICLIVYICRDYKTKGYCRELQRKFKEIKATSEYKSQKRLEYLERYTTQFLKNKRQDTVFVATFQVVNIDSIEDSLREMINKAEFEIVLVTPWIKQGVWNRFRWEIYDFIKNGGKLLVFINGTDEDFSSGMSDWSVVNEIRMHGGVVKFVPQFHAKLYVVDRREALISSANFTWGGLDNKYEAGVWTCNPVIVKDVRGFVERLEYP